MRKPPRRQELEAFFSYVVSVLDDLDIPYMTPEDIVIAKLIAYRAKDSAKHLRDARGVLIVQGDDLDWEMLHGNAQAANLTELLNELIESIDKNRDR